MRRLLLALTLCVPGAAIAQDELVHHGQGWSLLAGETAGANGNIIEAQAGYPGLSVGYIRGITDRFDLGGVFTFNYGFEGSVRDLAPGVKIQALARIGIYDSSKFNLGVHFAPGPIFYFPSATTGFGQFYYPTSETLAGFVLPAGLDMGIPVASAIMIDVGLEVPMFVLFGTNGGLVVPILVGAGAEYYISKQVAVSFNLRFGPTIWLGNYSYGTFEALLGVAYRI